LSINANQEKQGFIISANQQILGLIMSIGENIRRIRVSKGLTQGDITKTSKVKLSQISKIETGKVDPRTSTIIKLIDALDCTADSIFLDEEKTGIQGVLKEAFELASELPEDRKATLINLIDDICVANGLNTMLKRHRVLIDISREHGKVDESPRLLKEKN